MDRYAFKKGRITINYDYMLTVELCASIYVDWLNSLKQFFINVSYHILVASLTLMALLF